MAQKKKSKETIFIPVVIVVLFLTGLAILTYPTISDLWNKYRNKQLISEYNESVKNLDVNKFESIWAEAREYNLNHRTNVIIDAFNEEEEYTISAPYDGLLNAAGDFIMGYIEIPKIKVDLAIYHGIAEEVLQKGVGHVEGTSLPIGGENNHSVLSAHRGLPSAKLFTDLDQIVEGDIFRVHILNETLVYKVNQIKTVLPSSVEELAIEKGKDYFTLLTCTPYGVNTHRLLVRGERIDENKTADKPIQQLQEPVVEDNNTQTFVFIGLALIAFFIIVLAILFNNKKQSKEKGRGRQYHE